MPNYEIKINGNGDEGQLFKKIFANIKTNKKVIINWAFQGSEDSIRFRDAVVLNKEDARKKAKRKLDSLVLMKANNIPVVNFNTNYNELKFPVFGRKKKHKQGNDIKIYFHPKEIENSEDSHDFFSEFCPSEKEYRIHVFDGRILIASRKALADGFSLLKGHYPFIRNRSTGYRFKTVNVDRYLPESIKEACVNTANLMGLTWCAIDVLWTHEETPKILEVNTTPGLTNKKIEVYANAFKNKIQEYIVEGELDFTCLTESEGREEGLY